MTRAIWCQPRLNLQNRCPTILEWISECSSNHMECRAAKSFYYPKRLIDLGHADRTQEPKLVETKSIVETALSYTTLSHCWGNPDISHPPKTTRFNYCSYLQQISMDHIPQTYMDAIKITLALGIRYIWIDSLCIIQDDAADWEAEASSMAAIFENSFLTIAATSSIDSREGCFIEMTNKNLQYAMATQSFNNLGEGRASSNFSLRSQIAERSMLWTAALNQRGWTLQELALSPRTVHFTRDQLFWQCREVFTSEDGAIMSRSFDSLPNWPRLYNDHFDISRKPYSFSGSFNSSNFWWRLAQDYSTRLLTYSHDKLAAVAGIIKHIETRTGNISVLGLWKETLYSDLCWVMAPARSFEDSRLKNIPSWTWLSAKGGIRHLIKSLGEEDDVRITLSIIDWNVCWENEPYTSPLLSARLVLASKFIVLKPGSEIEEIIWERHEKATETKDDDFYHPDTLEPLERGTEIVLFLLYDVWGDFQRTEYFLSLSPVEDSPGTYRRIGAGYLGTENVWDSNSFLVPLLFDGAEIKTVVLVYQRTCYKDRNSQLILLVTLSFPVSIYTYCVVF